MLLKLALAAVLVALFHSGYASDAECPQGAVLSPYDPNVCYLFSTDATDYYDAADFCEKSGGHLSSVHDVFQNNFFRGAASSSSAESFWIGGSNNNANGTWGWEDHTPFDWTDWGPGQPNGTAGLCLYVNKHDSYWYGDGCVQEKPFMCKIKLSKPGLASCPNGWSFYSETKNCYKVLKIEADTTCDSAFQQCSRLNATAASIHSFRENSFISGMTNFASNTNWTVIGLIAGKTEWRWQDSSLLNYTRWSGSSASQVKNDSCILQANFYDLQNWFSFKSYYNRATQIVCELNGYDNSRKATRDSACPKGTIESPDNINLCYKIYSDPSNWYAAEQTCLKENGHLVSIHNSNENSYLLGVMPFQVPGAIDFWTGSFYNTTWKWSDNTPFDWTNWARGNPQYDSGLCLSEKVRSGFWYSTKCDEKKPFICALPLTNFPRPSCPPNFSYYDVTKKCYQIVQTNAPINSCDYAQKVCFNITSKVASIHSDEENYFITGLAMVDSRSSYYTAIGLVGDGIKWKWLDESVLDYTKWYDTYLPNANECAIMGTSFGSMSVWFPLRSGSYTQVACEVNAF